MFICHYTATNKPLLWLAIPSSVPIQSKKGIIEFSDYNILCLSLCNITSIQQVNILACCSRRRCISDLVYYTSLTTSSLTPLFYVYRHT